MIQVFMYQNNRHSSVKVIFPFWFCFAIILEIVGSLHQLNSTMGRTKRKGYGRDYPRKDNEEHKKGRSLNDTNTTKKPQFAMFTVGDRVRICHSHDFLKLLDCKAYNWAKQCPFSEIGHHAVGRMGTVHEIRPGPTVTYKVQNTMEISPMIKLYIQLDRRETEATSLFYEINSDNVVNYTLLGKKDGDEIFEQTRDRDFPWSSMIKDPDALWNDQMKANLDKIDHSEKTEILTTVNIFRDQAHYFYHRLFIMQLDMNRFLRASHHENILMEKNKS
jgi:hypothetical protein